MQAMPATQNESIKAGPALSCAATPVKTKMPVPMIAPTPRLVSPHLLITRCIRSSFFSSALSCSSDFLAKICFMFMVNRSPSERGQTANCAMQQRRGETCHVATSRWESWKESQQDAMRTR
jgi:hypothetical protein